MVVFIIGIVLIIIRVIVQFFVRVASKDLVWVVFGGLSLVGFFVVEVGPVLISEGRNVWS